MIIVKQKETNLVSLSLDENEKIIEIKFVIYSIQLKNQEEYNESLSIIEKAIDIGVDVFQYTSNAFRLEHECNKILSSRDLIIVIQTNDENKFELLENLIKWFMIKNKEYLH